VRDVFVRDLVNRTTELVSVASDGTLENSSAAPGSISADGNVVAFASFASNLVPDDTNDAFDVFVRNRAEGTTVRASVSSAGEQGNAPSIEPAVSGDGAFVAFASDATNLISDDTNERTDVFVYDVLATQAFRVSVTDAGEQADGQSNGPGIRGGLTFGPAISFDGSKVAFDSVATNLVDGDTNTCDPFFPLSGQCPDVFVRNWVAGTTIRVSVADNGAQSNDASTDPAMDDSGLRVAFFSAASNLVRGDTNTCIQFPTPGHCTDIFVHQTPAG
jgi:Tol biopolymer transport system component